MPLSSVGRDFLSLAMEVRNTYFSITKEVDEHSEDWKVFKKVVERKVYIPW